MTRFVIGADGVRLAFDSTGVGKPVVLLHGGGQMRHSWSRTAEVLAEKGYRAVTVDARGHGESDWAESYRLSLFAADLRAIIGALEPGAAPAVIGASLGGLTALLALGSDHPPPASALVLVDIALRNLAAGTGQIRDFMSANRDGFATLEEAADAVSRYMTDRPRPKNISGLRRNLRERDGRLYWHWDPKFMAGATDGDVPAAHTDLEGCAARLTLPTMLVRGEHSAVIDQASVAHLRGLIPQLETREVKGAGHMVAGDANSPFTSEILDFLGRHYPSDMR